MSTFNFRQKRERRAEKLRRDYERVGREQNGIFESLADYTHMVQAEVRALQITKDRISAQGKCPVQSQVPNEQYSLALDIRMNI